MNREIVKKAFEAYTSKFNLKDPNIYLKYIHTTKVAENCEQIARSLGMAEEDADLAWEIGMLHDIGRFEQLKRYHTFNDVQSIDHAQFGADLLFQEGLMKSFDPDCENLEIIETAIRCHSLYRIPQQLSEREILFCKIIRDADKVDIYRANYDTGVHVVYGVTKEELRQSLITPEVFEVFCEGRAIPRAIKKTVADHVVGHLALSFELEFPISKKLANEQGYLWKILNTEFEQQDTLNKMKMVSEKLVSLFEREKEL